MACQIHRTIVTGLDILPAMITLIATAAAADLTFVVVGDTQTDGNHVSINWDVFPQIVEDMNTHSPDVGLFVGDLVDGAYSVSETKSQWEDFVAVIDGFSGTALMVPGNHDVYGGAGTFDAFRQTFPWLPTEDSPSGEEGVSYYYDVGAVRFISITSDQEVYNTFNVSSAGMAWLDRVLSESDAFAHVFVMTHHPVSFSDEGGLGTTGGDFWQTLVGYGVTGLFAGHWHRYQPSQPGNGGDTWETIIGTGGGAITYAPLRDYQQRHGFLLVEVTGAEAVATFYGDEDGDGSYDDALDSFTLAWADAAPTGLIARYTFDDGAMVDTAPQPPGRGIDGELRGQAAAAEGVSGSGLQLDGTDDYAVAGAIDDYALAIHGDLTVSLWVKAEQLQSGDWANALLCYGTNDYYTEDEESNYAYWLNVEPDGRIRMFWEYESGTNVSVFSAAASWEDGAWHHVVAVRDTAAEQVRFFLDGAALGAPQPYSHLPTGGGRGMLYLGADTEGSGSYELQGSLDEVCIFDVALDEEQIGALAGLADCAAVLKTDEPGDTGASTDTGTPADTGTSSEEPGDTDTPSTPQDDSAPVEDVEAAGGCGCSAGAAGGAAPALLLLPLLVWRRQRSAPGTT